MAKTSHAALLPVSGHVTLHVTPLGKLLPAVGTLEGLGTIVTQPVPLQAIQREETLGALGAQVRSLAGVRARVHVQVTLAGEALAAADAGVRRLARVAAGVQQQLARRQEGLAAGGAQVVPLASVHLHVPGDPGLAEALPADGAQRKGPLVQPLVLPEGVAAQEGLLALATGKVAALLVQPLVLVVARQAGEALLALAAAVCKAVESDVGLQLIWVLEHFVALGTFDLVLREVFADGPGAQEAFVFSRQQLPSLLRFGLRIARLLAALWNYCSAILKILVYLFFQVASLFQLFGSSAFYIFSLRCFFKRGLVVLPLDVLLHFPSQSVSVRTLRAGE